MTERSPRQSRTWRFSKDSRRQILKTAHAFFGWGTCKFQPSETDTASAGWRPNFLADLLSKCQGLIITGCSPILTELLTEKIANDSHFSSGHSNASESQSGRFCLSHGGVENKIMAKWGKIWHITFLSCIEYYFKKYEPFSNQSSIGWSFPVSRKFLPIKWTVKLGHPSQSESCAAPGWQQPSPDSFRRRPLYRLRGETHSKRVLSEGNCLDGLKGGMSLSQAKARNPRDNPVQFVSDDIKAHPPEAISFRISWRKSPGQSVGENSEAAGGLFKDRTRRINGCRRHHEKRAESRI